MLNRKKKDKDYKPTSKWVERQIKKVYEKKQNKFLNKFQEKL